MDGRTRSEIQASGDLLLNASRSDLPPSGRSDSTYARRQADGDSRVTTFCITALWDVRRCVVPEGEIKIAQGPGRYQACACSNSQYPLKSRRRTAASQ